MDTPRTPARPRDIPEVSLRRLPLYYRVLRQLAVSGVTWVSCSKIGLDLGLDPTQVRKDIELTGIIGRPKVGYPVADLLRRIEHFLGWNHQKIGILAGAGSLGSALLGYQRFQDYGVNIVAAFDTDPLKVGQAIHGKQVHHLDELPGILRRTNIRLGVIATPPGVAQAVSDLMVQGGIRAIWNFAPVHLRVPPSVILQNEDLYHSLASLSFKLEKQMSGEAEI